LRSRKNPEYNFSVKETQAAFDYGLPETITVPYDGIKSKNDNKLISVEDWIDRSEMLARYQSPTDKAMNGMI